MSRIRSKYANVCAKQTVQDICILAQHLRVYAFFLLLFLFDTLFFLCLLLFLRYKRQRQLHKVLNVQLLLCFLIEQCSTTEATKS